MEELTPITRREVFLAKAAGQEVETPTPVTREEVFLDAIAKGGGGGGGLPAVTSADNGDTLMVKNGVWAASEQGKKFIVTLTPTSSDYSGTMDKTPEEITDAYAAGQEIEFDIPSLSVRCKAMEFAIVNNLIEAGAIVTYRTGDSHLLIEILTNHITSSYFTHVYSLTPAS